MPKIKNSQSPVVEKFHDGDVVKLSCVFDVKTHKLSLTSHDLEGYAVTLSEADLALIAFDQSALEKGLLLDATIVGISHVNKSVEVELTDKAARSLTEKHIKGANEVIFSLLNGQVGEMEAELYRLAALIIYQRNAAKEGKSTFVSEEEMNASHRSLAKGFIDRYENSHVLLQYMGDVTDYLEFLVASMKRDEEGLSSLKQSVSVLKEKEAKEVAMIQEELDATKITDLSSILGEEYRNVTHAPKEFFLDQIKSVQEVSKKEQDAAMAQIASIEAILAKDAVVKEKLSSFAARCDKLTAAIAKLAEKVGFVKEEEENAPQEAEEPQPIVEEVKVAQTEEEVILSERVTEAEFKKYLNDKMVEDMLQAEAAETLPERKADEPFYCIYLSSNAKKQIARRKKRFSRYFTLSKLRNPQWAHKRKKESCGSHLIWKGADKTRFNIAKSGGSERILWYQKDEQTVVCAELAIEHDNGDYIQVGSSTKIDKAFCAKKTAADYPAVIRLPESPQHQEERQLVK